MEAPDYSNVYLGGSLSPSLWDEDDWKKPDALNNDVILGSPASPQSPIFPNSFDGGLLPADDDLMWMEKSCNLESLAELYDVSVRDEIPMEDKTVELSSSFKQTTYENGKDGVSDGLFKVEGVEDLFHDYIDPDVYVVKDERRVSTDSGVSIAEDIENSFFSSASDLAGKDINIFDYNKKQGWRSLDEHHTTKPHKRLPAAPSAKLVETGFVTPTRPILPKGQGFTMSQPTQVVDASKVLTVVPVSTQQSVLIKPIIVNAKSINIKPKKSQIPITLGQVSKKVSLAESSIKDMNPIVVKVPTTVQTGLKTGSTQKFKNETVGFSPSAKAVSAKATSIDYFLSALRKEENLTPLQALLQESNNAKIEQPISFSAREEIFHAHNPVTELSSPPMTIVEEPILTDPSSPPITFGKEPILINPPSRPITFVDEPIITNPPSPPKQPVEVITYESLMGSPNTDQMDSSIQLEDVIVTCHPDSMLDLDPNIEMVDFGETSPQSDYLCSDYIDSSPTSSSSIPSLSPCNTKPYSRGPRKIGRRRGSLPAEEKTKRKKVQNKEAAIRYRQKKRDEHDTFVREENELYEKNKKLQSEKDGIVTEIKYLKGLLRDLYKAKGLIE